MLRGGEEGEEEGEVVVIPNCRLSTAPPRSTGDDGRLVCSTYVCGGFVEGPMF